MTAPLAQKYTKQELERLLAKHRTISAISRATGHATKTLSRAMKYYGLHEHGQRHAFYDNAYDSAQRTTPEKSQAFAFDILKQQSDYHIQTKKSSGEFNLSVPDEWFGIAFMADMHIGNIGADHRAMEYDARLIADTPGLYTVLGGDMMDNHIKIMSAIIATPSSPRQQLEAFEYLLSIFSHKILAIISGNHENWTKASSGIDVLGRVARERRIFYSPHEVCLNLQTSALQYRVALRHKYKNNSALNLCNTVKRMWEHGKYNFDVGVVCHHHEAEIETFVKHDLPRIAIRTGTYLLLDEYASREGFNTADYPIVPVVIFNPVQRKMHGFSDLAEGARYLKYLRENPQ